jgi:hypothetical protein
MKSAPGAAICMDSLLETGGEMTPERAFGCKCFDLKILARGLIPWRLDLLVHTQNGAISSVPLQDRNAFTAGLLLNQGRLERLLV